MACVPPRAGSDTTRKFPIAQGVPLSMKQILVRSSLWHKSCRGWPPAWSVRSRASQAVVVEEMEAIEACEGSEKKTMRWQRWQAHETMALIAAKKQQDLRSVESTEAAGIESKKTKNKWREVEAFCREKGIERSAQQCQARWSRLMSAFTQIRSWEETRKPEQPSFWSLKLDERKTMGFLLSLDQKAYNALDDLYNSKVNAIENAVFKDNVEEVVELGSVNQMLHGYDGKNNNANKADANCSRVQGEAHEVNNKTNAHTSDCLSICKPNGNVNNERYVRHADDNFLLEELEECELEECKGEKQVDRHKAMESTKILSEFLQMVVDDSSAGNMDFNPTNLRTGQQVESLKVSGIADHTNPLILCDQKDVNDKAQLLTASVEMSDGSNKDSCKGPLVVVDEFNKAQLLHANAENVDCNPTNLHTGQHAESLKSFGIAEHMNSKIGCDQKDANDKAQLLPASAKMIIDGSNKDLCEGSLEEHGAEETIVMHWGDDNVPFPGVMDDETVQAAKDKAIEKDAAGSLSKTNASVMDSLIVGGIANANSVFASVEESCESQKPKSHLSTTEVDALNANQSRQISDAALSCISIDKENFKNYSEDRSLAEEACIDNNEKGEGVFQVCEAKSILCPNNAEDISTAWADNIQSNFINDACQTGEGTVAQLNNLDPMMDEAYVRSQMVPHSRFEQQQGDLNPLLASKEEIGTSVLKQVPEDNSPRSEIFESISSDQDKDSHIRLSEEGHVEMIAVMTEGNATMLECSTGHSFEEKKVQHLQNGNNEYNEKTTETSQTIKHFEVAVKDTDTFVKKELCDELQSDGGDTIERAKVAMEEGGFLTGKVEIRASTVDTNPPALTCIQHQFQHAGSASEQNSTIKGDGGSFESVREANRAEVLEVAAKEPKGLEFTIKDDRGSPVTSGKGSIEDQKTTTSIKADDDVLLYIPAATGNFVRSALQIIRKFFKF